MSTFTLPSTPSWHSNNSKTKSTSNMGGFMAKLTSRHKSSANSRSYESAVFGYPSAPVQPTPTRRPPPAAPTYTEAPPAYTPPVNQVANNLAQRNVTAETSDSPYAFLQQFDTIFLIDDSGSMAGRSWRETSGALAAITPICTQYDADGIDIYFLNHRSRTPSGLGGYYNIKDEAGVTEIFHSVRPLGGTPTGTRLNQILKPYVQNVEKSLKGKNSESVKPLNIIVITDGVPSDDVESVIVSAAKKLDKMGAEPWQVGIQFFQVGSEPEAAEELKELDDALGAQHGIRDIVDTVPWTGESGQTLSADGILKVVLGAVNRRLDRRHGNDERLRR